MGLGQKHNGTTWWEGGVIRVSDGEKVKSKGGEGKRQGNTASGGGNDEPFGSEDTIYNFSLALLRTKKNVIF